MARVMPSLIITVTLMISTYTNSNSNSNTKSKSIINNKCNTNSNKL